MMVITNKMRGLNGRKLGLLVIALNGLCHIPAGVASPVGKSCAGDNYQRYSTRARTQKRAELRRQLPARTYDYDSVY